MGDLRIPQEDYGVGIYRGREAPPAAVYDALNALVDDEGQMFKRGVSSYYSASNAGQALLWLHTMFLQPVGATRVIARAPAGSPGMFVLDGSLAPVGLATGSSVWSRPASVGDYAIWTVGGSALRVYGGSLKTANYSTGTLTVTNGSTSVTGAGTSWLANVDPGMILTVGNGVGVVKLVNSDTSITLASDWSDVTAAGSAYTLRIEYTPNFGNMGGYNGRTYVAAAGAGNARLLFCRRGNRVYFTSYGDPFDFDANGYHELPAHTLIVGAQGRGDSALIFTTRGIWSINNLSLDPVDDAGNVQHLVEQVNNDVVLWDDYGVADWDVNTVVPAIDDVYLLGPDYSARCISEGIRPLYRSYVKAGYQPGLAAVHRGHYFLPIMNGTTLVDVLVCRLDRPNQAANGRVYFPWVRWSGHAAGSAYAVLIGDSARQPKLLGLSGQRVTNLTNCLDVVGAGTQDADATTPTFRVDENDVDLGPGIRPSTALKVRYVYETTGGVPSVAVSSAIGAEGSSFTAATLKRGGGASDGTDYSAWRVGRKAERIRFRFECSSQVTSLILRRRELTVRSAVQD